MFEIHKYWILFKSQLSKPDQFVTGKDLDIVLSQHKLKFTTQVAGWIKAAQEALVAGLLPKIDRKSCIYPSFYSCMYRKLLKNSQNFHFLKIIWDYNSARFQQVNKNSKYSKPE